MSGRVAAVREMRPSLLSMARWRSRNSYCKYVRHDLHALDGVGAQDDSAAFDPLVLGGVYREIGFLGPGVRIRLNQERPQLSDEARLVERLEVEQHGGPVAEQHGAAL